MGRFVVASTSSASLTDWQCIIHRQRAISFTDKDQYQSLFPDKFEEKAKPLGRFCWVISAHTTKALIF